MSNIKQITEDLQGLITTINNDKDIVNEIINNAFSDTPFIDWEFGFKVSNDGELMVEFHLEFEGFDGSEEYNYDSKLQLNYSDLINQINNIKGDTTMNLESFKTLIVNNFDIIEDAILNKGTDFNIEILDVIDYSVSSDYDTIFIVDFKVNLYEFDYNENRYVTNISNIILTYNEINQILNID